MNARSIPEDVMRAAAAACQQHGVAPMGAPFVPSVACLVAMTAIMAERTRNSTVALLQDRGNQALNHGERA